MVEAKKCLMAFRGRLHETCCVRPLNRGMSAYKNVRLPSHFDDWPRSTVEPAF